MVLLWYYQGTLELVGWFAGGKPVAGLVLRGSCLFSVQNCPILRIERHGDCDSGVVEVNENEPVYESHRLRAIAPGEDHEAVHQ